MVPVDQLSREQLALLVRGLVALSLERNDVVCATHANPAKRECLLAERIGESGLSELVVIPDVAEVEAYAQTGRIFTDGVVYSTCDGRSARVYLVSPDHYRQADSMTPDDILNAMKRAE